MRTSFSILLSTLLLVTVLPTAVNAQEQDSLSTRDGVFTTEQVAEGEKLYNAACLHCHQPQQFVGPAFMLAWQGQPVAALLEKVRTTMPEDNPGVLKKREYVALLTYLFSLNALPVGETEMSSSSQQLNSIRIEPAVENPE